jgi:hypothetical protein
MQRVPRTFQISLSTQCRPKAIDRIETDLSIRYSFSRKSSYILGNAPCSPHKGVPTIHRNSHHLMGAVHAYRLGSINRCASRMGHAF